MTIQEFQAEKIENAGKLLAHFVEMTPPDKRDWVPDVPDATEVRSMLSQVSECIHVNRLFATLIRGEDPKQFNPIQAGRPFTDPAEALPMLVASAKECADAVRGMSDEDLEKMYALRRGDFPGYQMIEFPYRNMTYHGGQVNLLQLLYGDAEFHVPK
jgi:hypothetical protein